MQTTVAEVRKYPPGDLAIWIFILAELLVFAVFFSVYAFTRASHTELFNTYQQTLDTDSALINTLALVTSSYFVMRAVTAIREGRVRQCINWLLAALVMGTVFLLVKSAEYHHHYQHGINLRTNLFYMFYLSLTFFHFMHVIMGMVILAAIAVKAKQGCYSAEEYTGVETGACYWHWWISSGWCCFHWSISCDEAMTETRPATNTVTADRYLVHPCTAVFFVLLALTLITWQLGRSGLGGIDISLLVLGFAMIKALLIGDYYMGLRGIHSLWRWAIIVWLLVPGSLISWAFISAS